MPVRREASIGQGRSEPGRSSSHVASSAWARAASPSAEAASPAIRARTHGGGACRRTTAAAPPRGRRAREIDRQTVEALEDQQQDRFAGQPGDLDPRRQTAGKIVALACGVQSLKIRCGGLGGGRQPGGHEVDGLTGVHQLAQGDSGRAEMIRQFLADHLGARTGEDEAAAGARAQLSKAPTLEQSHGFTRD